VGYLRFSLALLVLVSHAGLASESLSRTAVGLFLILSGYLMQLTLSVNYQRVSGALSIGSYFANRFLRIFPLYWATLIFVAISFPAYFFDQSKDQLLGVVLLDHQSAGLVIGPAWTLSYEITYSVLAPFVLFLGLRLAFTVSILAVLANLDFKLSNLSLLLDPFAWDLLGSPVVAQAICLFSLGASIYHCKSSKYAASVPKNLLSVVSIIFAVSVATVLASNWLLGREESFSFWESNSRSVNLVAAMLLTTALLSWDKRESRIGKTRTSNLLIRRQVIKECWCL